MVSGVQKNVFKAAHIANFILDSADKEGRNISVLKLLKMVYIFFGWASAIHGPKPYYLFPDRIEAWNYGPVVPSLYYELRRFGRGPIKGDRAFVYDPSKDEEARAPKSREIADKDKDLFETLEIIWDSYKNAPAEHLVALTHQEGTPWKEAYDGTYSKEIPKEKIVKYYEDLYKRLG